MRATVLRAVDRAVDHRRDLDVLEPPGRLQHLRHRHDLGPKEKKPGKFLARVRKRGLRCEDVLGGLVEDRDDAEDVVERVLLRTLRQ